MAITRSCQLDMRQQAHMPSRARYSARCGAHAGLSTLHVCQFIPPANPALNHLPLACCSAHGLPLHQQHLLAQPDIGGLQQRRQVVQRQPDSRQRVQPSSASSGLHWLRQPTLQPVAAPSSSTPAKSASTMPRLLAVPMVASWQHSVTSRSRQRCSSGTARAPGCCQSTTRPTGWATTRPRAGQRLHQWTALSRAATHTGVRVYCSKDRLPAEPSS
jgi:hypothetical protein